MSPSVPRAVALALVVLMLAPTVAAQTQGSPLQTAGRPDLIPSNPVATATDERYDTRVCTHVVNVGEGPSVATFHVKVTIDGQDAGERVVDETLQSGQGTKDALCWTFPLVKGSHTFRITVDVYDTVLESRENNNVYGDRSFYVAPTPLLDYRIVSLIITPTVGKPDSTQVFSVTVENAGNGAAPATEVDLIDDNGLLARLPVRALAPGERVTVATATATNFRPMGQFVMRAIVDPSASVLERNELNNEAIASYEVLEHPAPDLALQRLALEGNLTAKRGLRLDAVVANTGDRIATNVVARLLNATNVSLGNATRSSLSPGQNVTLPFYFLLPEGDHTLRVVLDPDGRLVERNETNNAGEIHVTILPAPESDEFPNLVLDRIDASPSDPRPGEPVSLTAFVRNVGDNLSLPHSVNFSLDGVPVGSVRVTSPIAPGSIVPVTLAWPGGAAGSHTVHATVDAQREVRETDEDDNNLTRELVVAAPAPPPPTPPAPTTPTPVVPTPKPEANESAPAEAARVAIGELSIGTRAIPGGVKGILVVSLRNPTLTPVPRMTVAFKVDGQLIEEVLVSGLAAAATGSARTREVDLPEGEHTVLAEVRILGSTDPPVTARRTYTAAAGESDTPGFEAILLVAAVAVVAMARRRTR